MGLVQYVCLMMNRTVVTLLHCYTFMCAIWLAIGKWSILVTLQRDAAWYYDTIMIIMFIMFILIIIIIGWLGCTGMKRKWHTTCQKIIAFLRDPWDRIMYVGYRKPKLASNNTFTCCKWTCPESTELAGIMTRLIWEDFDNARFSIAQ